MRTEGKGMPEEPIPDPNPVTEVRKKGDGTIIVERTHEKPVTQTTVHNIAALRKRVAKMDAAISAWSAKRAPLQAIIDEYEAEK